MSEMSSFCINLYPDDYKLVKDRLEEDGFEVQGDGKYFIFGHVRASAPDEELNEFFNALVDIKTKIGFRMVINCDCGDVIVIWQEHADKKVKFNIIKESYIKEDFGCL